MSGLVWVRVWLVANGVRVSRLDLGTNEGMKYLDISQTIAKHLYILDIVYYFQYYDPPSILV